MPTACVPHSLRAPQALGGERWSNVDVDDAEAASEDPDHKSKATSASGDMVVTEMERRVTHVENIDDVVADLEDGTGVLYEPPVNSNNSVVIGDSQAVDTLTSWWVPSPIMEFAHLTLKQVTIDALSKCKFGVPLHPKRLEIHTDGSTSDGPAAWANIFLLEDQEGSMWYAGYRTGMVVTDHEDDGFIGAARHTSSCAELSGIVWALKHAIQHGSFLPRADIFFDSEYAGDIAQATVTQKPMARSQKSQQGSHCWQVRSLTSGGSTRMDMQTYRGMNLLMWQRNGRLEIKKWFRSLRHRATSG